MFKKNVISKLEISNQILTSYILCIELYRGLMAAYLPIYCHKFSKSRSTVVMPLCSLELLIEMDRGLTCTPCCMVANGRL